jgi:hypothetical protein
MANLGTSLRPSSLTERLFLRGVGKVAPSPSEVARNSYGILNFKWDSPCLEVEALWVSITPREITLSCKISHTHFSRTSYLRESLTNLALKRLIVRDSLIEVSKFLDGEIVASISYRDGEPLGRGWWKKSQLPSAIAHSRKVFGVAVTERAWDWNGEIPLG